MPADDADVRGDYLSQPGVIVDPFAGPGGWSEGLRLVGLADIGIEIDPWACATRAAAGHATIRADVEAFPLGHLADVWGLLISPPCQDWSSAGDRQGLDGESGRLIYEVLRWVGTLRPEWVACEQVPLVLPYWREFAHTLRGWGYDAWVGTLNAADFGIPQTRTRAFLLANRVRPVRLPTPTHEETPAHSLFGDPLPTWITMYEALGWGLTDRPAFTFCGGSRTGGLDITGGSWAREQIREAMREGRWVVDRRTNSKAAGWQRNPEQPMVPTVPVSMDRPSPTLTGKAVGQWRIYPEGEPDRWAKLTIPDALRIQSFRPDYPVQGGSGVAGQQVGNAVPPLLASQVVAALSGIRAEAVAA